MSKLINGIWVDVNMTPRNIWFQFFQNCCNLESVKQKHVEIEDFLPSHVHMTKMCWTVTHRRSVLNSFQISYLLELADGYEDVNLWCTNRSGLLITTRFGGPECLHCSLCYAEGIIRVTEPTQGVYLTVYKWADGWTMCLCYDNHIPLLVGMSMFWMTQDHNCPLSPLLIPCLLPDLPEDVWPSSPSGLQGQRRVHVPLWWVDRSGPKGTHSHTAALPMSESLPSSPVSLGL